MVILDLNYQRKKDMKEFGGHVQAKSSFVIERKFTFQANHVHLFKKRLESINGFLGMGSVNNILKVHPYGHNTLVINNNKDYTEQETLWRTIKS